MDKRLTKRLIALVLTGGILISSTGVYTALAATEETTTSEYTSALDGSDVTAATEADTTVSSTAESATSETTEAEITTEQATQAESTTSEVQKPATTQTPETTAKAPVAEEVVTETPSDNKAFQWLGVDGTETNVGSKSNPYAVSSVEHFLAMNEIINDTGFSTKYFQLTQDIDFSTTTIDSTVLSAQGETGMEGSLVSVDPTLSSSSVLFYLDGNGKKITGITIDNSEYASLSIFGYVNSASTITNLTVNKATITNGYSDAQAAGIILKNEGTVKDCNFTVISLDTTASSTKAESFYPTDDASLRVYSGTACIVDNSGVIDGETNYDKNTILVHAENITVKTSRPYAGAVVAQNRGKINKIRAVFLTVAGNSTKSDYVGGLVGANMTARTSSSTGIYYAEIVMDGRSSSVTGADKIGYLAGYNTGRIQRATVKGNHKSNVQATASSYELLVYGGKSAGGIVGENAGDVQLCTALDIGVYFADTSDSTVYGGIVGKTTYGIRNCIATGSTAGAGTAYEITRYIGGIVGYGDTGSNFSVENCYALVKIIDSKADLGAIVGFNGDEAYRNNKIKNVFYSGIISSRPSPVSYGGAGVNEGDLTFSKAYAIAYYSSILGILKNTVTVNASDFSFSGWGDASFSVKGNFRASVNASYYTVSGIGSSTISYELTTNGKHDKTVVNYDVDITIPAGVGASKEATVLSNEPMEFGILNSLSPYGSAGTGSGTKDDPFILYEDDINFLYYAPAAHFVADTSVSSWSTKDTFTAPSATFWGTIDFNGNTLTYETGTPLFKGIYGSRDDSLTNNNSTTHKSSSADNADTASNLANGVVKNITINVDASTAKLSISNIFGNICDATVKNVLITFVESSTVVASEANSGLFAKAVYGNSYIYGCYVDSNYNANGVLTTSYQTSVDGTAGFIGTVDAEKAIIDNCGTNLVIYATSSGIDNSAVFIGTIKALDGGYIQNCYAAGGLAPSGGSFTASNCNIFAGNIESASSSTYIYNCYFSLSDYHANNRGISSGIKAGSYTGSCKAWSFVQKNESTDVWGDITLKVSAATDTVYVSSIENMDRFDLATYGSDTLNVGNHFTSASSNETTLTPGKFGWYGRVGLGYTFAGTSGASATLTVKHNATGLVAKLMVFNSSDLEIDDAGYYLIKTPIDLYYLSTNQTKLISGSTEYMYMSSNSKIKLAADIDMSGHTIEPIGSSSVYFKGEFIAGTDTDGSYFTISNLTFTTDNTKQALFGYVQGATIKGVHLDNASITGGAYTAALVGNVYDYVKLESCKVTNSAISGTNHVGALIGGIQNKDDSEGTNKTIIENCSVESTTVTSTKSEKEHGYIGGIIGGIGRGAANDAQYAEITGCTVTNCEISADAYGIGGIVGYARNNNNTITSCTVTGTSLICTGTNGATYASLGGIAGLFGGSSISKCTVTGSTITGECAAGIVTRLTNEAGAISTVSECTVTNSTITSDTIAGGILSQISAFATSSCYGDKIIDNCKVSADTTVKALVSGGIVGNIQQFSDKNLTVSNCTNLGTVETTGKKGSITDGAGGIIGRISTGMSTAGISVTGCLSQGTIKGDSNLGGIIGINNAYAHTGTNKMISNCYVTSDFSSKNLAVVKGLVIGYVGYSAKSSVSAFAENVVYSSLDTRVPLYGNVETTLSVGGGYDMNMGEDQTSGITVDIAETYKNSPTSTASRRFIPYYLHAIVGYKDGMLGETNVIELKTDYYIGNSSYDGVGTRLKDPDGNDYVYKGTSIPMSTNAATLAATTVPRFSVGNLPVLTGTDGNAFAVPSTNVFSTTASSSKIIVGSSATYNKLTDVNIQTFSKKCQAVVKTTYTGIINGETVTFDVGFTVIVRGEHAFDGSGTKEDPFKIYEAEDLLSIKQHHDMPTEKDDYLDTPEYYYEAYYEVMNDIDMTEELANDGYSFAPIGTSDEPFKGHIFSTSGNQFTISNMLIDNPASASDYAYSSYYDTDKYSEALGVFGYTDGAEILDLKFENVEISAVPSETNSFLGIKTGAVIGVAANTTIQNVEVTGTVNINVNGSFGGRAGAIGGIVGEAKDAVILTDVAVKGTDNDNRAEIKGLYQVGGIVGSAADSTGGSITNAVVENADITNSATSGVSIAGGVAGQYSGTITGSEVSDDEGNITETRVTVNNVSVTGTVAGGVVGTGNINNLASGGCDLTIKYADVTNTSVEVTESVRTDANAGPNGIAGGILGTTHESYIYLIEDCTVDSNSTVISGYCAGGIVGKVESRGVGTLQSEAAMFIKNSSTQASVTQTNAPTTATLSLSDDTKRGSGAGSVIGVITTNAYIMNTETNAPQIQITNVTAGGNISGTFNVGGIVGEFASVQAKLYEMSDSIVYDCIVTAKLTALENATERFGVILGSIEGNQYNSNNPNEQVLNVQSPFPEQDASGDTIEYAVKPFDKIFYSSYTAGEYNLYGLASVKDYQDPVYSVFFSTIYDVNQVAYNFTSPSDGTVTKLPISVVTDGFVANDPTAAYQWFGESVYEFTDDFEALLEENEGSGTPFGFTIAGKDFTLVEDGVQSADKTIFEVIPNPNSNSEIYPYKITVKQFATADLVFTYTNGLQIAIPVICGVNFEGDGSTDDPIKVANADIFYHIVKVLPSYSFIQTADIDLSDGTKYPATEVAQIISNFTGTYDGWNEDEERNWEIKGFNVNIDSAESPIGIFGKVSGEKTDADGNVIPNVQNVTFVNCTVNGGDAAQGTGVFAGAVTDGATISNVKVQNSAATSNVGNVGGAVGTVSGATTLENIEVTSTTVTTDNGTAGGVVGTITEDTVTVTSPMVSDTTVTSGTVADGVFSGGSNTDDIAGGIVAQALGTITGPEPTIDEEGNTVYANAVENVTVRASVSGGAVGAVYKTNIADSTTIERKLSLCDIRVSETDVVAKSADDTRSSSGAGLLALARNTTNITIDNCYVTKTTTASTVASSGSVSYASGAVANVDNSVKTLKITDTESYASVTASEAGKDGTVYASALVGYIINEPSILTIDGSVAGGKITGKAMTTYVAGVIGGFDKDINTEITASLFTNGVISAEVECIDGSSANATLTPVHRYGKFIARYGADMFKEEKFSTMFADNYYSSYPQDISFFSSESGESAYESLLTEEMFKDINVQGNLIIADEYESNWNSVAITKNILSDTILYAKLSVYAELSYGSGSYKRVSTAAGGFDLVATEGEGCIDLVGNIQGIENEETGIIDKYQLTVRPTGYGAEMLVAEYTCGLKTTGTIISVEIKGTGTETDPYLISTPTQLRVVAYLAEGNKYFRQINDIDLSGSYNANGTDTDKFIHYNNGKFYSPIGTSSAPFDGVYDGQGYKITGLKMERKDESDLGLFGVVAQKGTLVPTIRNVHLELLAPDAADTKANGIVGDKNIGGIAGRISNALIENCSVTVGTVTGKNYVGGIVGNFTSSKVINCFTQSDVNAFGESKPYAGGIVGYVTDAVNFASEISGCFASGSIYATPIDTTAGNDKSNAAGIVSYVADSSELVIDNCLFTGTTASGYGVLAGAGAMGMVLTITDCIDAGQNIAMAAGDIFSKITNAVAPTTLAGTITQSGLYYDSSLLKVDTVNYPDEDTGFTGKSTTDFLSGNVMSEVVDEEGNPLWSKTEDHYPVPVVSGIKVVNYNESGLPIDADGNVIDDITTYLENLEETPDPYSEAYALFLSAPVQISEEEECNDINDSASYGKGLVYPVTLLTNIDENKVTYSSSIFDTTDTVAYPEGFDTRLYGVGENKNVDLLFEDKDTGYTSVYRNIFDTTKSIATKAGFDETPSKNTYVNSSAASGVVFSNGEAYYNAQVPVVHATAEINGVEVERDIKIPLSYGSTYCIATQRQLYALGKAEYELVAGTKFSNYYGSTYNYKLITDIDCGDNETLFTPIGSDVDSGYTGQFDGSGHTIKNLKIKQTGSDYVGMFSKISKDYSRNVDPFIKNLTLENATVEALSKTSGGVETGGSYVGTLVGHVYNSAVTIENCHAIGSAEYERDADGEIVVDEDGNPVVTEYNGTVTGAGSYVGGLIGKVDYPSDVISKCSSSVKVSGSKDSVGGLIGESAGTVNSCYATGNVICDELTNGNICGVGGLIGIMTNGTVTQSFASGNVEVKAFNTNLAYNNLTNGQFGIGGFVGYVAEMNDIAADVISDCFSGGNVAFGTANDTSTVRSNGTAIVGVGGFSGINREAIANAYSSAAVKATFGDIANRNDSSVYGVGVGGICGVALGNVSDVYSSGSVAPAYKSLDQTYDDSYYGVGGTIGTTMDSDATCQYCYYDSWTNTDPNLTSIGGREDNGEARSLTTAMLTNGKKPSFGNWSSEVWGFTQNAYPYLKSLLNKDADAYIKTNSILSVVCVNVEDDDVSAKTGAGVTMALTVPTEFKYTTENGETVTEYLDWAGATLEGNRAAIIRSQNVREYVNVVAQVIGLEEYATRIYSRLCADMKGTFKQPYLIGNETDLAHVNMTADELETAKAEYTGFYDQWATPLNSGNNQVEGIVHYQLMSNVSVTNVRNIPAAPESYTYTITSIDENGAETSTDKTFAYQGFMFKGNGYAIKDVATTGTYFANVDENSMITNMIFDNFTFTGSNAAIVGTNEGQLLDVYVRSSMGDGTTEISDAAGLVLTNKGTIDGCVVDATISGAKSNVGVMAVNNSGTIKNSGTAGTLDTATGDSVSDIGAFVANNTGVIESSFSMADVNVLTNESADVQRLSGFAALNAGTMDGVYTRSAVSFVNTPADSLTIASLAGEITSSDAEPITNSYAAGLLGYFNPAQDSILFGTVPETMNKLSSVYVDKSLAGEASANSFKYSASLSSMMSMQYAADSMKYDETNNPTGKFVAGEETDLVLPQLTSILGAENHKVVDEEGNLIYVDTSVTDAVVTYTLFTETDDYGNSVRKYRCSDGNIYLADDVDNVIDAESGGIVTLFDNLELQYSILLENKTIIRNYDVIKAYSKISSMVLKTAQSQYADRLVPNSSTTMINETVTLNSSVSTTDGVNYVTASGNNDIIGINNSTDKLTTYGDGKDSIVVRYNSSIELSRGTVINPQLLIDVAVNSETLINTINPNFEGGLGTKDKPYIIHDAASLQSLHYYGTESELYFVLGDNIDMSGIDDFQIHVFTAHLNDPESVGENPSQYTISNFTSTKGDGGLFGRVESGAVINNVALTATIESGEQYVGALANIVNGGTITNCVVSADVTSNSADEGSATGVLAGRVTENAVISGIVTTGNASAEAGAVGGVIGYAENAVMSEFLSTANVGEGEEVAGIVGTMGENATLTNVLYGGVAESKKPIVASYVSEDAITNTYYDTQLNKGIEADSVIGEGKTTSECEKLEIANFTPLETGFYPVPETVANAIAVDGAATVYESYGATAALAAATMNFYLGSSRGQTGFYTSMQFVNTVSASAVTVTEENNGGYFDFGEVGNVCVVKSAKYNAEKDPAIILTLDNGATRTIRPGLVRNANISYTIINSSDLDVSGKTLGVLFKSVADKASTDSVNVLNDFTNVIGEKQTVDALIIAEGLDGFYVGEMLPAGYEYKISATLNGEEIAESDITVEENIYGAFVKLSTEGNADGDIETNVELTLEIVESDKPWGVNSIGNILW